MADAPTLQIVRIGRMEAGAAPTIKRCWAVWDGATKVADCMTREEAVAFHAGMAWSEERHKMSGRATYRFRWAYTV